MVRERDKGWDGWGGMGTLPRDNVDQYVLDHIQSTQYRYNHSGTHSIEALNVFSEERYTQ